LCAIVPGATIKKSKVTQQVVNSSGSLLDVQELLNPLERRQAWFAAIEEFIKEITDSKLGSDA